MALLVVAAATSPLSAVVISEIHYNPPPGDEALEFVELANDSSTPQDLSGYSFVEGVRFVFPRGTILPGRGAIVVCADVDAFTARHVIDNALGNFEGRLDAGGERLTLVNHAGAVVQSLRFRDEGKWPAAPDGTGHTLSIRGVHLDSSEPESWAASLELGGTPGQPNFPDGETRFIDEDLLPRGASWRFRKGTAPFSDPPTAWREPDFDDRGWDQGRAGFGYGDGDDTTVLDDMRNGYVSLAIRTRVGLDAEVLEAAGEILLAIDYDDGFCAFVNGVEVARAGCTANLAFDDVATEAHEAGAEETFLVPGGALVEGENVIAIVGHNFSLGSSDFTLNPRLLRRQRIESSSPASVPVVFNELFRGAAPGSGWVELYNAGGVTVDLSGFEVLDSPADDTPFRFAVGTTLARRGFLVLDEAAAGLDLSTPEVRLFLRTPTGVIAAASVLDRAPPGEPAPGSFAEARFPDGGRDGWLTETPTRGEPNRVSRVEGAVINEIYYHPPENRDGGEFIELTNTGVAPVDLSGFRFNRGVDHVFEDGVVLAPGAFLVVAGDPELVARQHGITGVHGPWNGRLADAGENIRLVDRLGNLVDEVRYHEGGDWSLWADGRGASLELIDPRQENDLGSAWDASDESSKTRWEKLSFTAPNVTVTQESELHVYLVERGICRIDDVSVTRVGSASNFIPNPGFESSTTRWRIEGTHMHSRRVTTDAHTGGACLEVVATGKGDTLVNRIETDTSPRLAAGRHEVSLWARWVRGASLMMVHGEYHAGPYRTSSGPSANLSGNSISAALRMTVPENLGTPGAENSVTRNLRSATGDANLGPVIGEVSHDPPFPAPGQGPVVTARIVDADDVATVRVFYARNRTSSGFDSTVLRDDGRNGDGGARDGVYGGRIAGFGNGDTVLFFLEATDARGATRRYPADASASTLVYRVESSGPSAIDRYSVIMDADAVAELGSRQLHSNDLLPGTFVFDDREVVYGVGVRYRGSPWGRPGRSSFRVRFPRDHTFHRGRKAINLSSRGAAANEGAGYFLVGRNSGAGRPAATADYLWVQTRINGASRGTQGMIQPVDRDYLQKWYGEAGADGPTLKAVGRLLFNDAGQRIAWEGASLVFRGDDPENYRGYWAHSVNRTRDDYAPLVELARVMDASAASDATFDTRVGDILDVDLFLRVLAPRILMSDWDAVFVGNGHNGYLTYNQLDGLWSLLPFDMDNTFGNANASFFPTGEPNVVRMLSRPLPRRTYFRILDEFARGYWSVSRVGPYLDQVQRDIGVGTGGVKSYIDTVRTRLLSTIRSSVLVEFRILTGDGGDARTNAPRMEIQGEAPVTVATMLVERNGGELEPFEPNWTTPTRWRALVDTPQHENRFLFTGFDGNGSLIATTTLTVFNDSQTAGPEVQLWFPKTGPAAGGLDVSLVGVGFEEGLRVRFGSAESPLVTVVNDQLALARVPPAPPDVGDDGAVTVEVIAGATRIVLPEPFIYQSVGVKLFLRGDANGDGGADISDAVTILGFLFLGDVIECADGGDVNDDGKLELTDAVALLDFLFRSGAAPRPPHPEPGRDPTADDLACGE